LFQMNLSCGEMSVPERGAHRMPAASDSFFQDRSCFPQLRKEFLVERKL